MTAVRVLGRYALYDEIAHGGMATVHFGRLLGPVGFARTVAIKRLHPHFAKDPEFVSMFLDEARVAARIRHPNVVPTLDVVAEDSELFLVMEYVQGESLSRLMRAVRAKDQRIPLEILSAIASGSLQGLHAAHEATSETGEPLNIVHRDVSPQNILVGVDGVPRVLDFGIAKAAGRLQTTKEGQLKGKLAYMPPEQVQGAATRRTDVYAIAVVLWESLTGERLFHDDNPATVLNNVLSKEVDAPSKHNSAVPKAFDDIVMKGLARDPRDRFSTAREMARAIEQCVRAASASDVGDWVESIVGRDLDKRATAIAEIESDSLLKMPGAAAVSARSVEEPKTRVASVPAGEQSSVSVATSSRESLTPRRSTALPFAIAAIVALCGVVIFLLMRAPAEPPPVVAAPAPLPIASTPFAAPTPTPSAIASSPPPPPASTSVVKTATKPTSTAKPAAKKNCDPPYEYDANGKKRYKPECF